MANRLAWCMLQVSFRQPGASITTHHVYVYVQKDKDGSQSKMVHFYFSRKDAEDLVERVCCY